MEKAIANAITPDIERLRKFSLAAALMLMTYVAAGVRLEGGAHISVFGLPFVISRPELLPLALFVASGYGLIRYFYYGVMLHHTPHWCRKELLQKLVPHGGHGQYKGEVFFGPSNYSTTPMIPSRAEVEKQILEVIESFPKVWNVRVTGKIEVYEFLEREGEPHTSFYAEITIPIACRLAAFLQDVDYTVPIWLNLAALTWAAFTI